MKVYHKVTATQEEVVNILKKTAEELEQTLKRKGSDYSGNEDTFKNFKLSADLLNIPVEIVILSRMGDKISRLASVINKGEAKVNETLEDTLDDLIGYVILLKTYLYKKGQLKEDGNVKVVKELDKAIKQGNYRILDDDGYIN